MGPVIEMIAHYAREHYEPPKSFAEVEEEAKWVADQLRKQAGPSNNPHGFA